MGEYGTEIECHGARMYRPPLQQLKWTYGGIVPSLNRILSSSSCSILAIFASFLAAFAAACGKQIFSGQINEIVCNSIGIKDAFIDSKIRLHQVSYW